MRQAVLGQLTWRKALLVLTEYALIVGAVEAAAWMRAALVGEPYPGVGAQFWRMTLIAVVLQICLHGRDLYDLRTFRNRRGLVVGLLQALGSACLILALIYFLLPSLILGPGVLAIAVGLLIVLVAGWRLAFEWLIVQVGPRERLLILGTSAAAVELADEIVDRQLELGVELVGFIEAMRSPRTEANPGIVGVVSDIPRIVRERRVHRVVVSFADARGKLSMIELLDMKLKEGVRFDHLASVYEEYTGKIAVENLRPSWLIFSDGFKQTRGRQIAKRASDMVFALLGLVIAAPIMGLVAIAMKIFSPGPVFYSQERVGLNGHVFTIYKFRSMTVNAEAQTGAVWSVAGDPRVTPIGRFLRRTRLDELPQLWNVLRGDMSFVGPRPERPVFVRELTEQIPFYGQRHVVRPGLTGWAQVCHRYGSSLKDAIEKLQYDLFYVKHMSVGFDWFILLSTVKTVLVKEGS